MIYRFNIVLIKIPTSQVWWQGSTIPALRRSMQEDTGLVQLYRLVSKTKQYLCSLSWVHTCLVDPLACLTFSATPPKSCTSFICLESSSLSPFPPTERRAPNTCSYLLPKCVSCKASLRSLMQQKYLCQSLLRTRWSSLKDQFNKFYFGYPGN